MKKIILIGCSECPHYEHDPQDLHPDLWGKRVCHNIETIKITGDQINIIDSNTEGEFPKFCPLEDC